MILLINIQPKLQYTTTMLFEHSTQINENSTCSVIVLCLYVYVILNISLRVQNDSFMGGRNKNSYLSQSLGIFTSCPIMTVALVPLSSSSMHSEYPPLPSVHQ